MDVEWIPSYFISIDVNLDLGLPFDYDPGNDFYTDPDTTFVLDPSRISKFGSGPAFDSHHGPVLDSILRLPFDSTASHSSNFEDTGSKR
ncbi:hypothetical protein EVAR_97146_1 [Eumeta japonica]|uniref:Uncharacterized protein n=1 Tax=Eumeta variegata TaxID=151549 RepID=A0A4C1SMX4_EUMVA|nr:hypothetical protein EVAR_97140_1 [Eumeta japonica]GBP66195.1 hypothetical protein EVAR_97146_1 [Eumeta japonica]